MLGYLRNLFCICPRLKPTRFAQVDIQQTNQLSKQDFLAARLPYYCGSFKSFVDGLSESCVRLRCFDSSVAFHKVFMRKIRERDTNYIRNYFRRAYGGRWAYCFINFCGLGLGHVTAVTAG